MNDDAYTAAVELLRAVSRKRLQKVSERPPPTTGEVDDSREWHGAVMRPIEDEALLVVQGLLSACDYDKVFRAIEEADTGWLRAIMLDRALDSLTADEGAGD